MSETVAFRLMPFLLRSIRSAFPWLGKASEVCSDESISRPLGTFKCDRRKRLSNQAMLNSLVTPNDNYDVRVVSFTWY